MSSVSSRARVILFLLSTRIVRFQAAVEWRLVWNDEFDGLEINRDLWDFDIGIACPYLCGRGYAGSKFPKKEKSGGSLWNFEIGDGCELKQCKSGNSERQFYTDRKRNAFVKNGRLVIQARRERTKKFDYTSARMKTKGRGDWKFGKIEIRAKFPRGEGILPQIWLLPSYEKFGKWPASGHIDLATMFNSAATREIFTTVICGPVVNEKTFKYKSFEFRNSTDFVSDFNVFILEWAEDKLEWFVNGIKFFEHSAKSVEVYPFNEKFYLVLSLAVGGQLVGDSTRTAFPVQLEIDYVRVFQKF